MPQLCTVTCGKVMLENKTQEPVMLRKNKSTVIKFIETEEVDINKPKTDHNYYEGYKSKKQVYTDGVENLKEIEISPDCKPEVRMIIKRANMEHSKVYNKDLTGGYNGYFGKHECKLN